MAEPSWKPHGRSAYYTSACQYNWDFDLRRSRAGVDRPSRYYPIKGQGMEELEYNLTSVYRNLEYVYPVYPSTPDELMIRASKTLSTSINLMCKPIILEKTGSHYPGKDGLPLSWKRRAPIILDKTGSHYPGKDGLPYYRIQGDYSRNCGHPAIHFRCDYSSYEVTTGAKCYLDRSIPCSGHASPPIKLDFNFSPTELLVTIAGDSKWSAGLSFVCTYARKLCVSWDTEKGEITLFLFFHQIMM